LQGDVFSLSLRKSTDTGHSTLGSIARLLLARRAAASSLG